MAKCEASNLVSCDLQFQLCPLGQCCLFPSLLTLFLSVSLLWDEGLNEGNSFLLSYYIGENVFN